MLAGIRVLELGQVEAATTHAPPLHAWPWAQLVFTAQSVQPLGSAWHSTTEPVLLHCLAPRVHWLEQVATQLPPLQSSPPAHAAAVPKARQPLDGLTAQVRTPPVSQMLVPALHRSKQHCAKLKQLGSAQSVLPSPSSSTWLSQISVPPLLLPPPAPPPLPPPTPDPPPALPLLPPRPPPTELEVMLLQPASTTSEDNTSARNMGRAPSRDVTAARP